MGECYVEVFGASIITAFLCWLFDGATSKETKQDEE